MKVDNHYQALIVFISSFSTYKMSWDIFFYKGQKKEITFSKTLELLHRIFMTNQIVTVPSRPVAAFIKKLQDSMLDNIIEKYKFSPIEDITNYNN